MCTPTSVQPHSSPAAPRAGLPQVLANSAEGAAQVTCARNAGAHARGRKCVNHVAVPAKMASVLLAGPRAGEVAVATVATSQTSEFGRTSTTPCAAPRHAGFPVAGMAVLLSHHSDIMFIWFIPSSAFDHGCEKSVCCTAPIMWIVSGLLLQSKGKDYCFEYEDMERKL